VFPVAGSFATSSLFEFNDNISSVIVTVIVIK
jgi:hypothetical protein